jgi:hypothetical protein
MSLAARFECRRILPQMIDNAAGAGTFIADTLSEPGPV